MILNFSKELNSQKPIDEMFMDLNPKLMQDEGF